MREAKVIEIGSLINGVQVLGNGRVQHEVRAPYDGRLVGLVDFATLDDVDQAIVGAEQAFQQRMKEMPAYQRADILRRAADLLQSRAEQFAQTLCQEAAKPIRDARGEVARAIQVFRFAAEAAKQNDGELIKMDAAIGGENRLGFAYKYPIGVVAAITPFNFPLNLVLHKVAPAIAAGCTVVLKPAEKTPLSAMQLALLMYEAGLPEGALQVVMGTGPDVGEALVSHPLIKKITFTGSGLVGHKLKELAIHKKVTLELGSNSANIIFNDANQELAVESMLKGGFAFAGQACISVQRIYVQQNLYPSFVEELISRVERLVVGDPAQEETDVGPLITEETATRIEEWVNEAITQGAELLIGGKRVRNMYQPTILSNVHQQMKVVCQELFGPVVVVIPFETEQEVLALANDSDYGLQAAVFTNDINRAFRLAKALETGGVWINEVSTVRQDNYPYGGVKQSGIGKEGVRYALDELLETKFVGVKLS